jgi:anti-sigma factor RsiW
MNGHVDEMTPGYVLHTLDESERQQVEEHIATCPDCARELAEMIEVTAAIPLGLATVDPPADLKTRLLAAARADAPTPAVGQAEEPIAPAAPIPFKPRERSRNGLYILATLAAAAVVVFALGITLGHLVHNTPSPHDQYNTLVENAVASGDRVTALRPVKSGFSANMAIAVAPSGKTSLIVGPTQSPQSQKVYQLWFIKSNHPVSAGVMIPNPNTARTSNLPISARGYQVAAVTVEPSPDGSSLPTTKPFIVGNVAAL